MFKSGEQIRRTHSLWWETCVVCLTLAIGRMDATMQAPMAQPPMPIIVGAPRSGTTLLRFMLDSHPALAVPPETGFLPPVRQLSRTGEATPDTLFRLLTGFPPETPFWADFGLNASRFRQELEKIQPFEAAQGVRLFYRLYAERFGKTRFGDKTPSYCEHMKSVEELLPEAHFIHIIRDGRDASLSLRPLWFAPGRDITTLALYWKRMVCAGRAAAANVAAYMEVRYERLISNPEEPLREICSFLRLPFDSKMLCYWERTPERLQEHKARVQADGVEVVSHQQRLAQQILTTCPPEPQRIGRWKREMTIQEQREFLDAAGDTLAEFGYARAA